MGNWLLISRDRLHGNGIVTLLSGLRVSNFLFDRLGSMV